MTDDTPNLAAIFLHEFWYLLHCFCRWQEESGNPCSTAVDSVVDGNMTIAGTGKLHLPPIPNKLKRRKQKWRAKVKYTSKKDQI